MSQPNSQPPIMSKLCDLDPQRCYLEPEFFARRSAICELVGHIAARIELTQGYTKARHAALPLKTPD
ncbi:hypothetical protein C7B69_23335 [filamentous cyanobacterium Phorm 46]|nr:hypothetical protein C7B69_23335 [filamentous cyanobacterium Phorm 46]PSB53785.1 hypothetical protein C7B67_01675 [filamentous cyanobacterium Phorm 6]